mmetsp:Transcript_5432/g.9091  ORF Transcript_5432/g.9091 Transcript_5432/m.9091 type:complete len:571 (-) Transcript_5432:174-1886(-)
MASNEDNKAASPYSLTISVLQQKLLLILHDTKTKRVYQSSFTAQELRKCGFSEHQTQNLDGICKFVQSAKAGLNGLRFHVLIDDAKQRKDMEPADDVKEAETLPDDEGAVHGVSDTRRAPAAKAQRTAVAVIKICKTDDFFGTIQFVMKLPEMEREESEVNKERLSDLCHVIEQQAATITNLQGRVQSLEEQFAGKVSKLEQRVNAEVARLERELQEKVAAISQQNEQTESVRRLEGKVQSLEEEVSALKSDDKGSEEWSEKMEKLETESNEKFAGLERKMRTQSNAVSELHDEVNELQQKQTIGRMESELTEKLDGIAEEVRDLKYRENRKQERVSEKMEEMSNKIESMETEFKEAVEAAEKIPEIMAEAFEEKLGEEMNERIEKQVEKELEKVGEQFEETMKEVAKDMEEVGERLGEAMSALVEKVEPAIATYKSTEEHYGYGYVEWDQEAVSPTLNGMIRRRQNENKEIVIGKDGLYRICYRFYSNESNTDDWSDESRGSSLYVNDDLIAGSRRYNGNAVGEMTEIVNLDAGDKISTKLERLRGDEHWQCALLIERLGDRATYFGLY